MSSPRTAAAVAVLALILYLVTLSPGLGWGDHADLQLATGELRWDTRVRAYPLWTLLSTAMHAVSGLEPAGTANLLTAILGAAAAGLVVLYTHSLTRSSCAAAAAGTTLAVSHMFWSTSVAAEVYSLSACFLLLLLVLARGAARGGLTHAAGFGFLAGLSLLHHRMIQVCAVAVGIVLLVQWLGNQRARRGVAATLLGLILGAVPFIFLVADKGLDGFLLGGFRPGLPTGPADVLYWIAYLLRFLALNFAGPQIALLVIGVIGAARRDWPETPHVAAMAITGMLVPLFLPRMGDRYVFLLPSIIAAAVLVARGASRFTHRRTWCTGMLVLVAVCPAGLYWTLANSRIFDRLSLFENASGTHAREFLWPGKAGDVSAEKFGREVLAALPRNALLLTEWGEGRVILYLKRVDGLRPDIEVRAERLLRRPSDLRAASAGRPVFFSPHPLLPLRARTANGIGLDPVIPGTLYRVTGVGE